MLFFLSLFLLFYLYLLFLNSGATAARRYCCNLTVVLFYPCHFIKLPKHLEKHWACAVDVHEYMWLFFMQIKMLENKTMQGKEALKVTRCVYRTKGELWLKQINQIMQLCMMNYNVIRILCHVYASKNKIMLLVTLMKAKKNMPVKGNHCLTQPKIKFYLYADFIY